MLIVLIVLIVGQRPDFAYELRRLHRESAAAYLDVLGMLVQPSAAITPAHMSQYNDLATMQKRHVELDQQLLRPDSLLPHVETFPVYPDGTDGHARVQHLWHLEANTMHLLGLLRTEQAKMALVHTMTRQLVQTRHRTQALRTYACQTCDCLYVCAM